MKKLITLLLLLSLVLSLMSGVSVSAFAAEDADAVTETVEALLAGAALVSADDADETPADEADEAPADDADEAPADDADEAPADDADEAPALLGEETLSIIQTALTLSAGSWTKADGFVDGQEYIIAVENGDGTLTALKNDGGKVVAAEIATPDAADSSMIWSIATGNNGKLISNNGINLYYNADMATTQNKGNWNYEGTSLYYQGQGPTYITFADGAFGTEKESANPAVIVLFTSGSAGEGGGEGGGTEPPPSEGSSWAEDTALTAGKTYVIGIKNPDGKLTVLKDDGGKVVAATIDSIDKADESMQWLYDSGLQNIATTADYLYYKDPYIRDTAAKNWAYAEGIMSYDSKGTAYYLTVTADAASCGTDSAAASTNIVLWSLGEGTGEGEGEGGDPGSDSSSVYTETTSLTGPYVGIVVDAIGMALSLDTGWHGETVAIAGEAPNRTMTATKGTSAGVVTVEGASGVALTLEDPPGQTNYLYVDDTGTLGSAKTGAAADYAGWNYSGTTLSYTTAGGVVYYVVDLIGMAASTDASMAQKIAIYGGTEAAAGGGGKKDDNDTAAFAPVFATPPEALPYVLENSNYAAPELSVVAAYPDRADYDPDGYVPEGAEYDPKNFSIKWSVDGAELNTLDQVTLSDDGFSSSVILNSLRGKTSGVYTITCTVSCDTWTVAYKEENDTKLTDENGRYIVDEANSGYKTYSAEYSVSFTVCKGILENSLLTFSDVHETWDSVGQAIANTIQDNGFLIPALIVCTGDWYNGGTADHDATENIISRLYAQVSGIDIVFLTGNHETGSAATEATIDADLGAAKDYNGVGVMYDSSYESASVGTSAENTGLVVFGINYDSIGSSYESILPELRAFFEELEKDYRGELVIISGHAGLHVLGVQPESTATKDWDGGASYNIDKSDEMVALINEYADTMDIMFFFGHDHSKGEEEFLLLPGTDIVSTVNYTEQTTKTQTLGFTYGHAGYIGSGAAATEGRNYYTLVTWDGDSITRTMTKVSDNTQIEALTATYTRVAEQPTPDVPDDPDIPDDPGNDKPDKPDKPNKPDSGKDENRAPKTGDDANIVLWIAILVLCAGSLAILPRKKHN